MVKDYFVKAIKTVHHHDNGSFAWSISGPQSINHLREAISVMSGKYKRFMFVHAVFCIIAEILIDPSSQSQGYQKMDKRKPCIS